MESAEPRTGTLERRVSKDLGQMLVEAGLVTDEQLQRTIELQRKGVDRQR